jgi:hypothetical protein
MINKYIDERPLTQIRSELGNTISEGIGVATWHKEKNDLFIIMFTDSQSGTAKLKELMEVFDGQLPREKRYNQIVSEFDRILNLQHSKVSRGAHWNFDDGWIFSITKELDDSGTCALRYVFAGL